MRARSELFNELYEQLRRLARQRLNREDGPTDATSLVHEAYLKLRVWGSSFQDDGHFLATASSVMRQILVDRSRARLTKKRRGREESISISLGGPAQPGPNVVDILLVDEALRRLAAFDERAAQITEMHIFLGLSEGEIAAGLGVSPRTVKRDWSVAKAWLKAELAEPQKGSGPQT